MRLLVLTLFILSQGCSVYTSMGRKDFETKSPDYVKTQALISCIPVENEAYDNGYLESFWSRTFFHTETHWVARDESQPYLIRVLNHQKEEVCNYDFNTEEEWNEASASFLHHLDEDVKTN